MRAKLYHMGIRGKVSRSTIAYANENRDWRIYCDFAQILIHQARKLYANDCLAVSLPLASRVVFQTDQAASSDKGLLWYIRKCSEDSNLDCDIRLFNDFSKYQIDTVEVGSSNLPVPTDYIKGYGKSRSPFFIFDLPYIQYKP